MNRSGEALADPVFPSVPARRGHYESYYLRAAAPDRPAAVWIRYTVHKRPGSAPKGSLWCTVWDGDGPRAVKETLPVPRASADEGWIRIGDSTLGPGRSAGRATAVNRVASWELDYDGNAGAVQHLPLRWLYGAPLPRTKTVSLISDARFSGGVDFDSAVTDLREWRGMVGHNWGSEHAERWIWLHGVDFADAPDTWLDCVLGRIRVGGRLTPWIANGVLSLNGQRVRVGGVAGARGSVVRESATRAEVSVPSALGNIEINVSSPAGQTVAWVYADPRGGEHHSLHCSIAAMEIRLGSRVLSSDHGGCYELGVRETDHGVPVQPFPDG
jgi:hypothetical protein